MKILLKSFMIDAARQPEDLNAYKRIVDYCSEFGFNAILFRLADDQGLAVNIDFGIPLICHPDAISESDMKELISYASEHEVDIIPELESFGHTRFLTDVPEFRELADSAESNPHGFTGLCPVHPKTLPTLDILFRKVASLFPSKYLHGGCDEVSWGGSALSRERIAGSSRNQIWTEYVNSLHAIAVKYEKEFMVWGDHILRKEPDILTGLDKQIIIIDWDYWTENPEDLKGYAQKAIKAGFRVIGGPALMWCKWGLRPGVSQLRNIDAFSEAYNGLDSTQCMGFILTQWCPWRYISDSYLDTMAYASESFDGGVVAARANGFQNFVKKHYGCSWDNDWALLFQEAYNIIRPRKCCAKTNEYPFLPVPWFNAQRLKAALKQALTDLPDFSHLNCLMGKCEDKVLKNHESFKTFKLAFAYLRHLYWRNGMLARATESNASLIIETIAKRDHDMATKLSAAWDATRSAQSCCKDMRTNIDIICKAKSDDQLVYRMIQAAAYSAELAKTPHEFAKIIELTFKSTSCGRGQNPQGSPEKPEATSSMLDKRQYCYHHAELVEASDDCLSLRSDGFAEVQCRQKI